MNTRPEDQTPAATQELNRHRRTTEFAATMLLALTSVATSWSGYQASLWSGIQATNYNQANALRVESARASTAAWQLTGLDVAVFMAWVNAFSSGNDRLEQFYRKRFRPEFRPAFDAWLAKEPFTDSQAPATPFDNYRPEHTPRAHELEEQSKALFAAGHEANHYADSYVLGTVLFAVVLFFGGIVPQFSDFRLRIILLGMGVVLLVFGLSEILVLPRAA